MGAPRQPIVDRFIAKIERVPSGCVEWQAQRDGNGYGRFWLDGKQRGAHRVSYSLFVGDVPDHLMVLHLCDNPPCVNPEHLVLGTHEQNQAQRRTCDCGRCQKCRWRDYMRRWSRLPENAERIRERVARRAREQRSAA